MPAVPDPSVSVTFPNDTGTLPSPPVDPMSITHQLLREYVAGQDSPILTAFKRALPQWIDDITRQWGNDTYERMLEDDDVSSAFETLIMGVMADGPHLVPAFEPPAEDDGDAGALSDAEQAEAYQKEMQYIFDRMKPGLRDLAKELLDGCFLGHKVGEKVLDYITDGDYAGLYGIRGIKTRPRRNYNFVVGPYNELIGLLTVQPQAGSYALGTQVLIGDPQDYPNFLPIDKFVYFAWDVKNGDPRGTSIGRSAYKVWFLKNQVWPEYYAFLRRFGTPSLVGKTPVSTTGGAIQDYVDNVDPATGLKIMDGTTGQAQQISAEMALRNALLQFMNGSVIAVKGGSEIDAIFGDGTGEALLNALAYFEKHITKAILKTSRATVEAEHGSKADTGTAQDILGLLIRYIRLCIEECLTDLSKFMIRVNHGEAMVKYAPMVRLSNVEQQDKAALILAYSSARASGLIHDSQLPGIDEECGMPPRDMEQVRADKAADLAMQQLTTAAHAADLYDPAGGLKKGTAPQEAGGGKPGKAA